MTYLTELNRARFLAGMKPLSEAQTMKLSELNEAKDDYAELGEADYEDTLLNKLSINMPDGYSVGNLYFSGKQLEIDATNDDDEDDILSIHVPFTKHLNTDFNAAVEAFEKEAKGKAGRAGHSKPAW